MLRRLFPAPLLLSACEGQIPGTNPDQPTTVSESSYLRRDPIMSNARIIHWQAMDDAHVYVLDGARTLWYGDGVNWQSVQTGVGWFVASPQSPGSSAHGLWIKDLQNNLYQWRQGAPGTIVASGVGVVKLSSDGYPYWVRGGAL